MEKARANGHKSKDVPTIWLKKNKTSKCQGGTLWGQFCGG